MTQPRVKIETAPDGTTYVDINREPDHPGHPDHEGDRYDKLFMGVAVDESGAETVLMGMTTLGPVVLIGPSKESVRHDVVKVAQMGMKVRLVTFVRSSEEEIVPIQLVKEDSDESGG